MTTTSLEHQSASVALIDACRTFCSIERPTDEQYIAFADQCAHIHSPAHATFGEYAADVLLTNPIFEKEPMETMYGDLKLAFVVCTVPCDTGNAHTVYMSLNRRFRRTFRTVTPIALGPIVEIEFATNPWRIFDYQRCRAAVPVAKFDAEILGKRLISVPMPVWCVDHVSEYFVSRGRSDAEFAEFAKFCGGKLHLGLAYMQNKTGDACEARVPAPAPAPTVVITGKRMIAAYPLEATQTTFPFELRDDTCFTPFFGHGTPVSVSMFDPDKHAVLCNTDWPPGVMHFKDLCISLAVQMNTDHAFHGNLHWTYRGERYEFPAAERSARGIRSRLVDTALAGKWPRGEEPQAVWIVSEF